MLSPQLQQLVKPLEFRARIIWAVMTWSVVIYGIIPALMTNPVPSPLGQSMPALFMCVAAAITILSLIIWNYYNSDRFIDWALHKLAQPSKGENETLKTLTPVERKLYTLAQTSLVPIIVVLALNESVAICGVIPALEAQSVNTFLPYGTVAILLNLLMFPKFAARLERARNLVREF